MIERLKIGWAMLAVVALAGLSGCGQDQEPLEILDATVEVNPSGNAPMAVLCSFTTAAPTEAVVTVEAEGLSLTVNSRGAPSIMHSIPLLGLRADREHSVRISVKDEAGNSGELAEPLTFTLGPIPAYFPPIEVKIAKKDKMEPGYSLIPFMRWPNGMFDEEFGLIAAIDADGNVVWFYRADHGIAEIRRAHNGNILYQYGRKGNMAEIDMLGNIVREWHSTGIPKDVPANSIPVETDTFHHDFFEMESGNFLQLSTEVRKFEDYPSSETRPNAEPKPFNVIGDVLIEHTPDGTIVNEWKFFDILDPYRIGYGSLQTGFWAAVYAEVLDEPGKDWAHINSIIHDPSDNSAIMSVYHQDIVFKLSLDTGELKWILGPHGGWNAPWDKYLLEGKNLTRWNYHQHAAKLTPQGTLLIFDNGPYQARPFDKRLGPDETYSRAVEFKIDEEKMEVTEVWQYGGPGDEIFLSAFICDVDWLPVTGNVLITDGGRVRGPNGKDSDIPFGGHHWARVLEVTHESPAEKVFELVVDGEAPDGWAIYRSDRIPSLYADSGA